MIKTVLFDLDGTLVDTAPDLADALNFTLESVGQKPLPFETIRPVVSYGSPALLQLGFGIDDSSTEYNELRQTLLDYYLAHIADRSRPFEGILELLNQLQHRDINWGVVTNKPGYLTDPLMNALDLFDKAATVVSGDTLPTKKPDPAPMHHAANEAGSASEHCLFYGDADRDIEAGRRAGMKTAAALFGYIEANDDPNNWGADYICELPLDLIPCIDDLNSQTMAG